MIKLDGWTMGFIDATQGWGQYAPDLVLCSRVYREKYTKGYMDGRFQVRLRSITERKHSRSGDRASRRGY
ncbi:MAG: hypothetical protein GOVbin2833_17 [Prokaryotic dsDNA virus sp.]|nr:MAG: hypothetical protein GOVbin2833_17 [Prokaryotic dsDNA virus sp.]